MKWILVIVLVVALLAGGVVGYLAFTAPQAGARVHFPLSGEQLGLVGRVPASAELFALVPSPGALQAKLTANPVTREAALNWMERQHFPGPWLLGRAQAVLWRDGGKTGYAIRFDPVRATLARLWMSASPVEDSRWEGNLLVIEPGRSSGAPLPPLAAKLADGLPPGDLLVIQTGGPRDYPPMARPAVTSATIGAREILLTSRAPAAPDANAAGAMRGRFARGAMLSATFIEPPRLLGDLGRLIGADLPLLLSSGGSAALYDVDTGTLLPRPRGVVVIPGGAAAGEAVGRVRTVADAIGETRPVGPDLLVSFDDGSIDRFVSDGLVTGAWPANRWALRIDPERLLPVVERLADSRALRFAAPRIHRSVRNLERWAAPLARAEAIEAADSVTGGVEELRVRVVSK